MYAKKPEQRLLKNGRPVRYICQTCNEVFNNWNHAPNCPICLSSDMSNLVVLYLEDDFERTEWLELIEFTAG